jgi:hypothetical protein
MSSPSSDLVSRRQWLGSVSTQALAATIGTSVLPAATFAAGAPEKETPPPDAGARVFNVREFGAKGDGVAVDTAAVQAAIDACASAGGGVVLVPAGTFLIGTVELKSNLTLRLAAAAVLRGSGEGRHYHAVDAIPLEGDSTLGDGNWALLFAVNATNVTVEGPGTIDGQGHLFNNYGHADTPPPSGLAGARRPYHLLFYRCERVVVRDLDLVRCAFHSIRVIQSRRVRMEGLYLHNRVNVNNDGFHFISAEHVSISNCTVLCQDDACALFGSCQFVTVTNCVFSTRWSVFRFGGGRVRNVMVSDCVIFETYGCPIKVGAGQMQLENLSFSNLILQDVTGPIGIHFSGQRRGSGGAANVGPAFVRNLSFSHIRASVVREPSMTYPDMATLGRVYDGEQFSCITLNAFGDAVIENVTFSDVEVTFSGGGSAALAAKRSIPLIAREYFGVWSEAPVGPPAYGLYARNVHNLRLHHVRFTTAAADLRPAIVLDHVSEFVVNGLTVQGNPAAESALRFTGVKDALLTAARLTGATAAFLQLEGTENSAIVVDGGDVSRAGVPVACRDGAHPDAARIR